MDGYSLHDSRWVYCIFNINDMNLSINIFDIAKFTKLRDSNDYLLKVTEFMNGYWFINVDDTSEVERLLNKNIIRHKIKIKNNNYGRTNNL